MTDHRVLRIAEIDTWFAAASAWGSWMVDCANEREGLVESLKADGHDVAHRFQARTDLGGRVS